MQLRPKYMHMYLIRNSCRHNLVWLHNPDPQGGCQRSRDRSELWSDITHFMFRIFFSIVYNIRARI